MKAKYLIAVLISGVLFGAAHEGYAWPLPEPPIAKLECPNNAIVGDSVILDGSGSYDPDGGSIMKYEWDFDYNDVSFDCDYSETPLSADCNFDGKTTHTYSELGDYKVMLKVTDDEGQWDYSSAHDIHVCRIVNITQDSNDPNIQAAINDACDGDVIVVAKGTYTGDGNCDIEFKGHPITVRSIDPNDAAVVAATIIDCQNSGRGFYFHSSETANSVLAGFTITNGYVTSSSPGGYYGGGIYCNGSNPTITNCTISSNSAYGSDAYGGGIYCDQSNPNIINCTISSNSTYGPYSSQTKPRGGGIYCSNQSDPNITNCTISSNSASGYDSTYGNGVGMYNSYSSPTVVNCVFSNNPAPQYGGGMFNNVNSSPTVVNCVFVGNQADWEGGGMYNKNSSPTLVNCTFSRNSAEYGGGMSNEESSPTVVNCTFSRNSADYFGGGIENYMNSDPDITNCILWGNYAPTNPEIDNYDSSSNPTVSYCDINQVGYEGNGNICQDPKFVDAEDPEGPDDVFGTIDDGLFLRTDSPCIDTGYNQAIQGEGIDTDIIGNVRIVDGNHAQEDGISATVDMGAYELPRIWYVDDNVQGGSGEGTSWANAYDKLQDALNNQDITDGNEIWVADGNYYPDEGSGQTPNDRGASFVLTEGVGVYGGFDSGKTARIDRDWTLYKATLSGDINTPDSNDNSYHVVTGADRAVLDGFTITGGNASGSDANSYGGGIYCYETSPIISNCTIADNNSIGDGGGIYCYWASPQISDCVIIDNNSSSFGGGMCNDGGPYYEDNRFPTITNCFFIGNNSGMVNYDCCGQMLITNCIFSGNDSAGVSNEYTSSPILINCTFAKNVTGMYNSINSNPTVINCIFWANTDREIHNRVDSNPTFSFCDIEGGLNGSKCGGNDSTDGGGNIDSDPCFVDINNPAGPDANFGTLDDGLRLMSNSPCIDAADGNAAPSTDILGLKRFDINDVNNTGIGDPNYADMGAYELGRKVVHFSGALMAGEWKAVGWSETFLKDDWSHIIGVGEYPDTRAEITNAVDHSLDGIAIPWGMRVIIYPEKDFNGVPLLDQPGPAIINNRHWIDEPRYNVVMTEDWPEPLQTEFPQSVREWSKTDMYDSDGDGQPPFDYWWGHGSFKIELE